MLTGEVKQRLIHVLTELVERHRRARAAVTEEVCFLYSCIVWYRHVTGLINYITDEYWRRIHLILGCPRSWGEKVFNPFLNYSAQYIFF